MKSRKLSYAIYKHSLQPLDSFLQGFEHQSLSGKEMQDILGGDLGKDIKGLYHGFFEQPLWKQAGEAVGLFLCLYGAYRLKDLSCNNAYENHRKQDPPIGSFKEANQAELDQTSKYLINPSKIKIEIDECFKTEVYHVPPDKQALDIEYHFKMSQGFRTIELKHKTEAGTSVYIPRKAFGEVNPEEYKNFFVSSYESINRRP